MVTLTFGRAVKAPRIFCAVLAAGIALGTPGFTQQNVEVERSFAVALVRDVLIAINQGNWTGNYTVLRDYASSDFSSANDPTRLAGLFAPVREAGLDMLPILSTEPEILSTQAANANTQMRLTGYFPIMPEHVSFDLVFVNEKSRWVLLDVSVGKFDPIRTPAPTQDAAE